MRIRDVQIDRETAGRLEAWARAGSSAVLLGREFAEAVVVTGAVPVPADEGGWEELRALRHGPVGVLGAPPPEEAVRRLLPGDLLVDVSAGNPCARWLVQVLDWTGPGDECRRVRVRLDVPKT